ncbi:hypothetical protein AKJ09_06779 [Labilithrix luteola]|uniref:DUF2846 domain-containing protein n=1 Tax=Labilithrix luteola TaxID=1391654 RepID=A0A0K1Q2S5_9BACT|nr:hypothetical protein [Labilithrix luteola]AKV00116.1 hypothetical protein AKJ09_06779 [Labilithrix luteola]
MRSLLAFACVALGAGCIPPQAQPTRARSTLPIELTAVPDDVARVCVMRPDSTASDVQMVIRDNGRFVGATRGGTYFCYLARPGEHEITSVDHDLGTVYLEAHAGTRYWLYEEVMWLGGNLHAHLDRVDEPTALEQLESCEMRGAILTPGREDEPDVLPIVSKLGK